jgi:hypothetical protein
MRRRKRDTIRGVTLAVVVGLTGSVAAVPATADEPATEPAAGLVWGACPDDVVVPPPRVLRCATMPVPVDYRAPDGEQIEIMISRPASTEPDSGGVC